MQKPSHNSVNCDNRSDGFIIVAVLWILAALSCLVSAYAVYVIDSAVGMAGHEDHLRAEGLASAAIELVAYRQLTLPITLRPTHGQFQFRLGAANVDVAFRSEAGRIDLNFASKPLLAGLFAALGARREDAETYADRVIGWRTASGEAENAEAKAYQSAGLKYGPRRAKFPHVDELTLVRDLPPALVERALPFVTVASGRAQVNILEAAPEVVAALPGMTRDRLNVVLAQRRASPDNPTALMPHLGSAQESATSEGSNTLRVTVHIAFDNGRRANFNVVVLLFDEGAEPLSVVSWHEEQDQPVLSSDGGAERR
jgi:general secretion pathway protein K